MLTDCFVGINSFAIQNNSLGLLAMTGYAGLLAMTGFSKLFSSVSFQFIKFIIFVSAQHSTA
jgi:hypothetical protein